MDDWATRPAVELAAAIRAGEVASRELLELYLDRIDRLDGTVNAVVTLDAERARREAAAADEALVRGDPVGPLHGLPVTIKDAVEVAGMRATGGAVELRDHVPTTDAPAVARLRKAGAVVFGKTNVPRWSGDVQTYNELFGTTSNPWAPELVPGGSSGGAAAAVVAGFTSFELGTDIGGSVRAPSHFCGAFGLKPSFGVVPQRGYLDQVGGGTTDADINVFGPIARSAADLDVLLDVLAGPEPERAVAWRLELPAPRWSSLGEPRIGVWLDEPSAPVGDEVAGVLRTAVDRLEQAGAKVEEAHPPVDFAQQVGLFTRMVTAAVSPSAAPAAAEALAGPHLAWLRNERERARLRAVWAEWFETYDLLLCPVTITPAFPHTQAGELYERRIVVDGSERSYLDLFGWLGLVGVLGLPSAVPPLAPGPSGLPVGVQLVAPFLRDREAVQAAGLVAEVAGGYRVPPGFG